MVEVREKLVVLYLVNERADDTDQVKVKSSGKDRQSSCWSRISCVGETVGSVGERAR